jgi:hypothetical protein
MKFLTKLEASQFKNLRPFFKHESLKTLETQKEVTKRSLKFEKASTPMSQFRNSQPFSKHESLKKQETQKEVTKKLKLLKLPQKLKKHQLLKP